MGEINVYFSSDQALKATKEWPVQALKNGLELSLDTRGPLRRFFFPFSILSVWGEVKFAFHGKSGTFQCYVKRLYGRDIESIGTDKTGNIAVYIDSDQNSEDPRPALLAAGILASITAGQMEYYKEDVQAIGGEALKYSIEFLNTYSTPTKVKKTSKVIHAQVSPKFAELIRCGTNGANYDLSTNDLIEKLQEWDDNFQVSLSNISHDKVTVEFETLPTDVHALAEEIYAFCPDVVDQHFGAIPDIVQLNSETQKTISQDMQELIEGIDVTKEGYGIAILARALSKNKKVQLWWD